MEKEIDLTILSEIRSKVIKRISEEGEVNVLIHPNDLHRFNTDDKWVWLFYLHCFKDLSTAIYSASTALTWRNQYGVNDLTEDSFPDEFFNVGGIYEHNRDKKGHKIIILHVREHVKGRFNASEDELKRFGVFWIEKIDRSRNYERVTFLFDLTGCGLANADMDMLWFMFTLFKQYYPYFLGDILVLNLPWVLSAFWKIFKGWLPERAQDKFKFVNSSSILEFVDAEQLPTQLGGTETFQYKYERQVPTKLSNGNIDDNTNSNSKKQVHFADVKHENHTALNENRILRKFLKISPVEELVFTFNNNKESLPVTLTLSNVGQQNVCYKVKTTSPNKYRVRPSMGLIKPLETAEIHVNLVQGLSNTSLPLDKFLVMAVEVEDAVESPKEIAELWRNCNRENIVEHKIRCSWTNDETIHSSTENSKEITTLNAKVNDILLSNSRLKQELQRVHKTVWIVLLIQFLLLMVAVYFVYLDRSAYPSRIESSFCPSPHAS